MRERRRERCTIRDRSQRGFSLSELMLVVALIALMALVALPAFGTFVRSWKLRSTADDMLAVIRGVRQMAITTRQDLTITFNPGKPGSYTYFHPIKGQTVTVQLEDQITVTTNPTASFVPEFRTNGGCVPSSTPSMSAPTANFVRLSREMGSGVVHTYTFGFSAAGMAAYTVTR